VPAIDVPSMLLGDRMIGLLAAAHEFAPGTLRHFAAPQQLGRFWSEADIGRDSRVLLRDLGSFVTFSNFPFRPDP
jgi:hypothetical protein